MSTGTVLPEAAELAVSRGAVYRLLTVGFLEPDEAWCACLITNGFWIGQLHAELDSLAARGRMRAVFQRLRRAVNALGASPSAEGLRLEHTRLFRHPATPCPPHETEYTCSHPFMKVRELADIQGFYRAFGMELSEAVKERPDFVATECEFMQLLCFKEADARWRTHPAHLEIGSNAQRTFLQDHLGRWLDRFADAVATEDRLGFYQALAACAACFVRMDSARLSVQPDRAAPSRPVGEPAGDEEKGWCETRCPLSSQQ